MAAPVFEKPLQQPHRARPHASSRRQQGRPAESHARSEYPQAQAPSSSSSNQQPETIFECLKPTRGNLHNKHRIPSLAKFIKNKEYLTKDENGNTALHFIIKKLYDEKIDLDICFSMINILITLLSSDESSISDDDLTAYLNEKDKDGNGPLDLLLQAQDLPHINSGDLTRLIARCKGLGATAHKLNENDTPNKESSLINKANEELTRIRNSGCGFFMSAEKHKAKVEALEKALASGNKAEISDALKMHRGIIPCHIFDAESTNAYKR